MKKVLFIATVISHIKFFHIPYLRYFKEKGYEVHVACFGDEPIEYCDKHFNIHFERFPFKKENITAYKELKKIMKENAYDIIHCHTPVGGVLGRLAAKETRKRNNTKVLYTAHGFQFCKGGPLIDWLLYYPVEKFMCKYTDCLITMNNDDYNLVKDKFKAKKVIYVHGIGLDNYSLDIQVTEEEKEKYRKDIGIDKDSIVLSFIGEYRQLKRQSFLIDVAKKLVNDNIKICLLLIGDGEYKDIYKKQIEDNKLSKYVKLLGFRTDKVPLLSITDIYVSASAREGLPVNIMEAMYVGVPIVSVHARGTDDLILNNENGILVDFNIDSFVNEVKKLIKDKDKCSIFVQKSREVLEPFLIDNVRKEMNNIYQDKI